MEPLEVRKRPNSSVPMPFFALGLVGLLAFHVGLALAPAAWRVPPAAHGILLLHLAVLA